MFDHMIKENKLMPFFEQADLNELDLIFIKELIFGVLEEQTNDQVSIAYIFYSHILFDFVDLAVQRAGCIEIVSVRSRTYIFI